MAVPLLTLVLQGESRLVTADQFRTLLDVAVRMMRDANRGGLTFTIEGLHASEPTIVWVPTPARAQVELDREFEQVIHRLRDGIDLLESDSGVPDWMTDTTANALYHASNLFGETAVEGMSFSTAKERRRLTRQTYRTLDRVLHSESDAIGSVTGVLVTATLNNGPHLSVKDELHDRSVRCFVDGTTLREAGQLIGELVTVSGRLTRDYLGRPAKITSASVERRPERRRVTVAEMGGNAP